MGPPRRSNAHARTIDPANALPRQALRTPHSDLVHLGARFFNAKVDHLGHVRLLRAFDAIAASLVRASRVKVAQ